MALKKKESRMGANRRRVADEAVRLRDAGVPVLAKDIAESLSMSTATVGKHLRAIGWSFHGPMGWYGPSDGDFSAWDADCKTWCAPSATVEGAMAEADRPTRVGRCEWFWPTPDAERVIEDMGNQAEEFVEDGADLWLGGSIPQEDVDDLQRRLQEAVDEWMRERGLQPLLFRVVEEAPC